MASMGLGSQMLSWGSQCSGSRSFPPSNGLQGGAALRRSLLLLCPGLEAKMGSVEACLGARSSERRVHRRVPLADRVRCAGRKGVGLRPRPGRKSARGGWSPAGWGQPSARLSAKWTGRAAQPDSLGTSPSSRRRGPPDAPLSCPAAPPGGLQGRSTLLARSDHWELCMG